MNTQKMVVMVAMAVLAAFALYGFYHIGGWGLVAGVAVVNWLLAKLSPSQPARIIMAGLGVGCAVYSMTLLF